LPIAQSVVAVEIDRGLCQLLTKQLGRNENFLLLQGDILSLDLADHLLSSSLPKLNKVVANILQHHRADSRKTTRHFVSGTDCVSPFEAFGLGVRLPLVFCPQPGVVRHIGVLTSSRPWGSLIKLGFA